MAALHQNGSTAGSDSRRMHGGGEQPVISSPQTLSRPGSASQMQEDGSTGVGYLPYCASAWALLWDLLCMGCTM